MSDSKKEQIIQALESKINTIKAGDKPFETADYIYQNTVQYINRQYLQITPEDITNRPKPWIIINNDSEIFEPYPSEKFDNNIMIHIAGFVEASENSPNLDSLMNSLQRDIIVAILSDRRLGGIASNMTPRNISTVSELIWPFGGFVIAIEINYSFMSLNL